MLPWPTTINRLQGVQKLLAEEGNHSSGLTGALREQPVPVCTDACSPVSRARVA